MSQPIIAIFFPTSLFEIHEILFRDIQTTHLAMMKAQILGFQLMRNLLSNKAKPDVENFAEKKQG